MRAIDITGLTYGRLTALGVKICDRWREFENFYADMGEPNGLTLDRIDPFGGYEPENCRWATWETQRENKRSAHA